VNDLDFVASREALGLSHLGIQRVLFDFYTALNEMLSTS
jgi:hypothetical protein